MHETLKKTLVNAGMTVVEVGGELFVTSARHPGHEVPAQSCEIALICLSRVCDRASSEDGQGFSKYDADFGHSLANAARKYGTITGKQLKAVQKPKTGLINKYRKQLTAFGFDLERLLDQLPLPPLSAAEKPEKPEKLEKSEAAPELVEFVGEVRATTAKALRIKSAHGVEAWFPRSMLTDLGAGKFKAPAWKYKQAFQVVN